jgi:primary-amine oxidase
MERRSSTTASCPDPRRGPAALLTTALRAALATTLAAALLVACGERGASSPRAAPHPLDPLSAAEIDAARSALESAGRLTGPRRVVLLDVHEPPKTDVLAGRATRREAFAVLFDARRDETAEAVVDLATRQVRSWRVIPGAQPPLGGADVALTDSVVRADTAWRAALGRHGVTDPAAAVVLPWAAGYFGDAGGETTRLVRAATYVRAARGNEMARPVDGVIALVDLTARRVVRVDDAAAAPVPDAASERDAWQPLPPATTSAPPAIGTPSAAGGAVDGSLVRWRRWRLRFAVRPREGLVLYDVGFDDGARVRSVLYRASLSEMVVPYGDPGPGWFFRNSFDAGEIGMGVGAASLRAGIDAPAGATLVDAVLADERGVPRTRPHAVAVFERDGGLAWKHGADARRARELVVSYVTNLGNYDYGFEWIFHEDGTIAHRAVLTGVMAARGAAPGAHDSLAMPVAHGVAAVHHQHFFNYRLDLDVDGAAPNRVEELETRALDVGPGNPYGGGFGLRARVLATEHEARRPLAPASARRWLVTSGRARNALGTPTGYLLQPGDNAEPFARPGSWVRRRAGFLDAAVWVTPEHDDERFAAGDYPNQSAGGDGLPRWTAADRAIDGTDVVLWYTLGITHNPRPEDWPVMPVHEAGFRLLPVGFFSRNPVLDRP